jgi:hypothetical protein
MVIRIHMGVSVQSLGFRIKSLTGSAKLNSRIEQR